MKKMRFAEWFAVALVLGLAAVADASGSASKCSLEWLSPPGPNVTESFPAGRRCERSRGCPQQRRPDADLQRDPLDEQDAEPLPPTGSALATRSIPEAGSRSSSTGLPGARPVAARTVQRTMVVQAGSTPVHRAPADPRFPHAPPGEARCGRGTPAWRRRRRLATLFLAARRAGRRRQLAAVAATRARTRLAARGLQSCCAWRTATSPGLDLEPAVADFVRRVRETSGGRLRIRLVDNWAGNTPGFSRRSFATLRRGGPTSPGSGRASSTRLE